jgi:regulator of replication initiation timing
MSSRKNDIGPDAFDYIDVEELHPSIEDLRAQVKQLDAQIEHLVDEVDKLNKINSTLREQLLKEALGLTE